MSDYNTDKENAEANRIRGEAFHYILLEQFQLAYFGRIYFSESDNMQVFERRHMYKILLEQKKKEREAQEEIIKKRNQNKKSSSWRRKR